MPTDYQSRIDAHFQSAASYWKQIYDQDDVLAAIHQLRRERVLRLVDQLAPKTARVLEIGCGAGLTTVAMAERGFYVDAIDTVQEMIDYTRDLAERSSVAARVHVSQGDVHRLQAPDDAYDLVLTIGVLPWLPVIEQPLREMCRVLRPGGILIVNIDNKWSLHRVLDPALNPITLPLKHALRNALWRRGWREPKAREWTLSRPRFDRQLSQAGFTKIQDVTLGFGPFTLFGREPLSARLGERLNRRMQDWAGGGVPVVRSSGSQYLVAARREG